MSLLSPGWTSPRSAASVRPSVEHLLSRHHARAELRGLAADEITYTVRLPIGMRVDALSDRIMQLAPKSIVSVDWDEKKARG